MELEGLPAESDICGSPGLTCPPTRWKAKWWLSSFGSNISWRSAACRAARRLVVRSLSTPV